MDSQADFISEIELQDSIRIKGKKAVMIAVRILRVVFIVLLLAIQSGMFFTACETSNNAKENSSSGDDDDNDANVPEDVWTDLTSGLMWQVRSTSLRLDWYSAIDHCNSLVYAGYNDWKLPSISELRSLIRGCPATQTGGDCGITESCLDHSKICYNDECVGCELNEGPANGCYLSEDIGKNLLGESGCRGFYWSTSLCTDYSYSSYDYNAWGINFNYAGLGTIARYEERYTLCVR